MLPSFSFMVIFSPLMSKNILYCPILSKRRMLSLFCSHVSQRNVFFFNSFELRKYYQNSGVSYLAKMQYSCRSFNLLNYDCIGFDLDNTLCEYKIRPMAEMEYFSLARYLCNEKNYDSSFLLNPLSDDDIDFFQRGLILDLLRGNILKLSADGTIIKACHGTKDMTETDIIKIYGANKKWYVTDKFCEDMLSTYKGTLALEMRSLLDYFDMPASLLFARAVDYVDFINGESSECYDVGKDLISALVHAYDRYNYASERSEYFKNLKSEPSKYMNVSDASVINWLKDVKKSKFTFLLTGSNVDYASSTAAFGLGDNWMSLFDVVICFARKPGFFTKNSSFLSVANGAELGPIGIDELKTGNIYSQGNWFDLMKFISKSTGIVAPKCVYFGDNLVQDVYSPSRFANCDTVAVIEELSAEGMSNHRNSNPHQSQSCLISNKWGSYFYSSDLNKFTIWGHIIKEYSSLCIPSIKCISDLPLNHLYSPHSGFKHIYYPSYPCSLNAIHAHCPAECLGE